MRYFPHLSAAYFSKCDYAALWMPLLGTFCQPAFATGLLPTQHNRGGLLSLTSALRNVLNYPILSLSSKLSTLSDFAQMFKEKVFFFFCFKWMSRAWHNTVQRNAQVSTVQKLVMSSLPLSSFSTSQKINMGTIMLAQCLKKTTRKCGGEALTGKFPRLLCAELSGAGWYVQGALPEAILVLLATPKPLREVRSWGNSEGVT